MSENVQYWKDVAERLMFELAGCSIAALGGVNDPMKQGDYGWTAPYQDVLDLRNKYEALLKTVV